MMLAEPCDIFRAARVFDEVAWWGLDAKRSLIVVSRRVTPGLFGACPGFDAEEVSGRRR
jgi:hypothetical protein